MNGKEILIWYSLMALNAAQAVNSNKHSFKLKPNRSECKRSWLLLSPTNTALGFIMHQNLLMASCPSAAPVGMRGQNVKRDCKQECLENARVAKSKNPSISLMATQQLMISIIIAEVVNLLKLKNNGVFKRRITIYGYLYVFRPNSLIFHQGFGIRGF